MNQKPVKCELFYSSGGHGGPYPCFADALAEAKRRLIGGTDAYIDIRAADNHEMLLHRLCRADLETFSAENAAAFINAQVALLNVEIATMQASNYWNIACGNSVKYGEEEFGRACEPYQKVLLKASEILRSGIIPK